MAVSALRPWEDNPRLNDHAVAAVAKSISTFGFNVPILCDQNSTIIAGHTRWKAAKKLGMQHVPVIVLRMSDSQRRAFSVADNKTAQLADWDIPRLTDVLEGLRSEEVDLNSLGFLGSELAALRLPEEEFNWEAIEEGLGGDVAPTHVLFPVKVPPANVPTFAAAVDRCAKKHGVAQRDRAVMAGEVLGVLLGLTR